MNLLPVRLIGIITCAYNGRGVFNSRIIQRSRGTSVIAIDYWWTEVAEQEQKGFPNSQYL